MNKTEFINTVTAKAGLSSKAYGKKVVDSVLETITEEITKGEKVSLLGFGTFSVVERAERKGINPRTKEELTIPARKVVQFKAGTELTDAVK
jgi:DNA-binding protein HU-beta